MEAFEQNNTDRIDPVISTPVDQPIVRRRSKKLWLCLAVVLLAVVVQVILVAVIWKPILYRISPKAYLAVALNYTAYNTEKNSSNTPSGKLYKAFSYLTNGSMDLALSVETDDQESQEYTLHTSADRFSKRIFIHATEKSGEQESELKYYSDKSSTIIESTEDGSHFAYSFPCTDLKDKIAGSAIEQSIGQVGTEYLVNFISESRLITEFLLSGDEMLQPYLKAFMEELDQYPMDTKIEEDTINEHTAQYKVFHYYFTAADLYKLSTSITKEMEAQGDTPTNEMLVYFLDGVVRGFYGISDEPESLEEAIDNINQLIIDLRSELNSSLDLRFYVDGLNVVQTKILLSPRSDNSIDELKFEYTVDPKSSDTVLETSMLVDGIRVNETRQTTTKKVNGWIIQTETTQARYLDNIEEDKTQISWNPKSGELQLLHDKSVVSLYLKESRNKIVFRVDDIAQLLSQLGADTELNDFKGSFSAQFSTDKSAKKPNATSILDVKDEDIHNFIRTLRKFDPLSGLYKNENRLIDNSNVLSSEYEEELLHNINKFVNFYEVDLVFVTAEGEDNLVQYADDFYHNNLYGIGMQASGYIVVFDTVSNETVIRSFGMCDQWLDENHLNQIGEETTMIYAEQGIENALSYCYERLDSDVYPHYVSSL